MTWHRTSGRRGHAAVAVMLAVMILAAPVAPTSRRIEVLDLLRGIAILGTLGTNIWLFTDPNGPAGVFNGLSGPGSELAATILRFLANGKFLALLTLLFGIGLELQYQSARRRGTPWPGWYLWRAGLLFLEGLLHYLLVFEFDLRLALARCWLDRGPLELVWHWAYQAPQHRVRVL